MRCKTGSFVVEFPLRANTSQRGELDHRFYLAHRVYNCMVREAKRRLDSYFLNKEVKAIRKEMRKKGYKLSALEKDVLKRARERYGLSEYSFHAYLTTQARMYRKSLDANTVQKIGTSVWTAVSKVLFGNGKQIHFKSVQDMMSVEGKANSTGIRYRDGYMHWLGLSIPIKVRTKATFTPRPR